MPAPTGAVPGRRKLHGYQLPFDVAYHEVAQERNIMKIRDLFAQADTDGSGGITLEEFQEAMSNEQTRQAFSALGIQPHHSRVVFEAMDVNGDLSLTLEEFTDGLRNICHCCKDGTCAELDQGKVRAYRRQKFFEEHAKKQSSPKRPATAPAIGCRRPEKAASPGCVSPSTASSDGRQVCAAPAAASPSRPSILRSASAGDLGATRRMSIPPGSPQKRASDFFKTVKSAEAVMPAFCKVYPQSGDTLRMGRRKSSGTNCFRTTLTAS